MARQLDARQKDELVDFLEELYRAAGYETQAEWARDADFPTANLSKTLNRSNRVGLDGYNLLKLIRVAAARVEATPHDLALGRAREAAPASLTVARRLEALEATVGAQGAATTLALEALAEGMRRLERRLPAEAAPATPNQRPRHQGRSVR